MRGRGVGHLAQAEIDSLGEQHVEQADAVATGRPGSQVREGLGEPGGVVHCEQDVRDPHVGYPPVEVGDQVSGPVRHGGFHPFDAEQAVVDAGAGDRTGSRRGVQPVQTFVQREHKARAATLERHAAELFDLPVDRVGKPEVLRALERVWTSQPGTGRKLRTALGALFRHARAAGLIEVDPVAAVAGALVPQPAVRQHMCSVVYADAPAAMKRIDTCRVTLSAKACLRFQILTAARPSEARLATWEEIAEDAREWRIPACRMKRDREHVVPLVPAAVALLDSVRSLRRHDGDDALVFPSPQAGAGSLSAATVAGVMKSAGLAGAGSPHGWRSTFRTWASERADADYVVMETSLSQAVGSAVERSYSRSTFLDKRRALLDAWSEFLAGDVAVIAEGRLNLRPTTPP